MPPLSGEVGAALETVSRLAGEDLPGTFADRACVRLIVRKQHSEVNTANNKSVRIALMTTHSFMFGSFQDRAGRTGVCDQNMRAQS